MSIDDFYMEDVGNISSSAVILIEDMLSKYSISLTDKESDVIFDAIFYVLESKCMNDYKHHN